MMILGDATKVEHYEVALYRGLITLLKKADKSDLADKLKETLDEEESTANKLEMFASGGFGKIVAKLM
jgi:ferritin-like metal-binding protein YciE